MKKKLLSGVMAAAIAVGMLAGCSSASTGGTSAAPQGESTENKASGEVTDIGSVWKDGATVTVDVPAKAGGGTDLYTRYLTQALDEVYPKVNFVVTNYDTGEVGMQHTKNAKPDGLTLNVSHGGAIIQYMTGASQVSIKDDLKPVALVNQGGPQAVIVNADAPYSNFEELGEYIKAHPGEVTVGCSLGGTTQVLFTSLIGALTGDPAMVSYVQCSNEADKLTQVSSNSINVANCSIPNAKDYDADGKLKVIGTIGPKASDLKSMSELLDTELDPKFASTVEQGVAATWDSAYYLLAPAGVADDVSEAINEAVAKAEEQQSFIDGNKQMATFAEPVSYSDTKAALDTEWSKLEKSVGALGLKER